MNFRSVLYIIGLLISTLGCMMIIPALFDLFNNHNNMQINRNENMMENNRANVYTGGPSIIPSAEFMGEVNGIQTYNQDFNAVLSLDEWNSYLNNTGKNIKNLNCPQKDRKFLLLGGIYIFSQNVIVEQNVNNFNEN